MAGVSPIAVIPTKPILPARRRASNAGRIRSRTSAAPGLAVAPRHADRIVELQEVDPVAPQSPEARLERPRDRRRRVGEPLGAHADLGGDETGRPERLEGLAEVLLRQAVAVERRGVEEVHAELERTSHRSLALGRGSADHETADVAAPEPERRYAEAGPSQHAILHLHLSFVVVSPTPPAPAPSLSRGDQLFEPRELLARSQRQQPVPRPQREVGRRVRERRPVAEHGEHGGARRLS